MIRPEFSKSDAEVSASLATNGINQRPTLGAQMDSTARFLLDRQLRRIDRLWDRYEETGDEKWQTAALDADRAYLRLKARLATF